MNAPDKSMRSRRQVKRVAQVAVLGLLVAGTAGMMATSPAFAAGKSTTVFNCYTQWWNTAWGQRCPSPGAKYAGTYVSGIECTGEPSKSFRIGRAQGSTTAYDGTDCIFSAKNGWISYL